MVIDPDLEAVQTLLSFSRAARQQQEAAGDLPPSGSSSDESQDQWYDDCASSDDGDHKTHLQSAKVRFHKILLLLLLSETLICLLFFFFYYSTQRLMSCTPPRTPSPASAASVTSMPVSVIMIGKKDGTAEPVQQPKKRTFADEPTGLNGNINNEGPIMPGRQVIFVENKNTNRHLRNANFGMEQIFVANKDTNRETRDSAGKPPPLPTQQQPFSLVSRSSPMLINAPVPEIMPGTSQVKTSRFRLEIGDHRHVTQYMF